MKKIKFDPKNIIFTKNRCNKKKYLVYPKSLTLFFGHHSTEPIAKRKTTIGYSVWELNSKLSKNEFLPNNLSEMHVTNYRYQTPVIQS